MPLYLDKDFFELYFMVDIKKAFDKILIMKFKSDEYCDLRKYIFHRINKDEMRIKLQTANSRFDVLYIEPYPQISEACSFWRKHVAEGNSNEANPSDLESEAIFNWVYKLFKNTEERILFTHSFFYFHKDLSKYVNVLGNIDGVFYNKEEIDVKQVYSIDDFNNIIDNARGSSKGQLFYRGHSNVNYILKPSVFRNTFWKHNESVMYNELIINCPHDFEKCSTHLEKLVLMQHYGLPTRLLDITRNPLVALYFASETELDSYGEVIIISAEKERIKYPHSDTVTILASLPLFSEDVQNDIRKYAKSKDPDDVFYSKKAIARLLHEIKLEKPAFLPEIDRKHLSDSFIVNALKNNNRIIKQDGAFILCGLLKDNESLNRFRYRRKDGKKIVILIKNKEKILKELDSCSINRATLFPEIDCVSDYIKKKYSSH